MKFIIRYIAILLFVLCYINSKTQNNNQSICRIEGGTIYFQINLKWNIDKRMEISKQYDLDSLVLAKVFEGQTEIKVTNEAWYVKKISLQIVELSKKLDEKPLKSINKNNVLLAYDNGTDKTKYKEAEFANYGVNQFETLSAFQYINGVAKFFFPNNKKAQKVYLTGTFNDWNSTLTPMHKVDSGWVVSINIEPGMYYYKYIIDGKWKDDPNNKKKIRDGNWGFKSIVFCYNFQFALKGYSNAKKVYVAGSFNYWYPEELIMNKTNTGWVLPMFLREGTHAYKFIVDGVWILDPSNSVSRTDGHGNINSFVGIGEEHVFTLTGYPYAKKVFLMGNFNAWNPNELEMEKVQGGWQIHYALAPGNYEYKFVIDGKAITDPTNPFKTGWGIYTNSILTFKANYTFKLSKFQNAYNVYVSGSFNNWSKDSYRMEKKDGKWIFSTYLKPGKYTYKFIVDGEWMLDPENKLWEENEYGTGNSILWIEP